MSKGTINKIILVGNAGKKTVLNYTSNGNPFVRVSLATTDQWTDSSGNSQEETEWHNIVIYSKLAELAAQFVTVGTKIYVEGRVRTNKWTDPKTGIEKSAKEVIVQEMTLMGTPRKPAKEGQKTMATVNSVANNNSNNNLDDIDPSFLEQWKR